MQILSFVLSGSGAALEVALIVRTRQKHLISKFPYFFSYMVLVFLSTLVGRAIYQFAPAHYANVFWFCFIGMLLAEFAVILEASEHIFRPYRLLRNVGRWLMGAICLGFVLIYIIPSMEGQGSSRAAIFNLVKSASLAKALMILMLFGIVRMFRLYIEDYISGMLLGLAAYLAVNVANVSLAERLGANAYGRIFAIVGPLSYVLALVIWNAALWQSKPFPQVGKGEAAGTDGLSEPALSRFRKSQSQIMRMLRR